LIDGQLKRNEKIFVCGVASSQDRKLTNNHAENQRENNSSCHCPPVGSHLLC
jgi:hypothetical protein